MATFTPLETTESLKRGDVATAVRGRGHRTQPVGIVTDKSCRVYIANIPLERIERDANAALRAEFEAYGPIESYNLFMDKTGRFVGNGICTYRNPADAAMALANMNGQLIDGTPLSVSQAKQHGVVLLRQDAEPRNHGFLNRRVREGGEDDSGSWRHDKYEMLAQGKEMDEVLGIQRRGGRGGRGGFGGRGAGRGGRWHAQEERVDRAFEKYLTERDRTLHPDADFDKYIAERDALLHSEAQKEASAAAQAGEAQAETSTEPIHHADTAETNADGETS